MKEQKKVQQEDIYQKENKLIKWKLKHVKIGQKQQKHEK